MPFFEFSQNNSGGWFDIDHEKGIGPRVWVEAASAHEANQRAHTLGLYFDGVGDCECCGNRWREMWCDTEGVDTVFINCEYDFKWHDSVYVHMLDGVVHRIGPDLPAFPLLTG